MSQSKAEFCHSHCPHFHWVLKNGSVFVDCAVVPEKIEILPDPNEVDDFMRDVERNERVIIPMTCQAIAPIQTLGTVDLYKRNG